MIRVTFVTGCGRDDVKSEILWKTEAELVADFVRCAEQQGWTAYAETEGWDLLIVRKADGFQVGIEAKMSLNATVLCQVLARGSNGRTDGPDCHAVLVPAPKSVHGLQTIARHLGIVVIEAKKRLLGGHNGYGSFSPDLPDIRDTPYYWAEKWPELCPDRRLTLPDYVPDVAGGHPAPVRLTPWKVAAIKIAIIIEIRGFVTRADFKALNVSSSRWTQFWLKSNGESGWIPKGSSSMPNLRAQHPVNYEQIKADAAKWMPAVSASLTDFWKASA